MLYIELTVQNLGSKEQALLFFGKLAYQIIKAILNNIKQSVYSCEIVKRFIKKCSGIIVPFRYLLLVIWIFDKTESLSTDDI